MNFTATLKQHDIEAAICAYLQAQGWKVEKAARLSHSENSDGRGSSDVVYSATVEVSQVKP